MTSRNNTAGNRMIQVKNGVIGPREPRPKTLTPKVVGDYPEIPGVYLEVCELYGPKFGGPPLCDELVALIQHMFTEEEASILRHLKPLMMMTPEKVAAAENRQVEEVREILARLADDRHIILSFGRGDKKSYLVIQLLPGVFETVLTRKSMDTLTAWERRFAELFEALFETGYTVGKSRNRPPLVRYLPAGSTIEHHPMALPSDYVEEIVDPYDVFAVGLCQCRMAEKIVGRGCDRPMENCAAMGVGAKMFIKSGQMRPVSKQELVEIKREAEAAGLVNWMTKEGIPGSNGMCSCCGCCCFSMRSISEFNMPGEIAPPHFMPEVDLGKCDYCGKCAKACPMGAITVDAKSKTRAFEPMRCVGCGQCLVACDIRKAIQLEPVPDYKPWPLARAAR